MQLHHLAAFLFLFTFNLRSLTCAPAHRHESAEIHVYWNESIPFIYEENQGELIGIEADLLKLFRKYLAEERDFELKIVWREAESFSEILSIIRKGDDRDAVGASAMSITDKREQYADFSFPYLPDITVMISSQGTPLMKSFSEIRSWEKSMRAITIAETQYETLFRELEEKAGVEFSFEYIPSDSNILVKIISGSNYFGFIDLPIYLLRLQDGEQVVRQNLFTNEGRGYGFLLPQGSQWKPYLDSFLSDPNYQGQIDSIASNYLGRELFEFIESTQLNEEFAGKVQAKEYEQQLQLIKNENLRLEQERRFTRILFYSVSVTVIVIIILIYLFFRNQKTAGTIIDQKDQILEQKEDIEQKNMQLMNRNAQLVALNEEKNNLVRILAHDIRSPLSQIMMVADIFKNSPDRSMAESDAKLLDQIGASAERINQMVTKILDVDALDGNQIKVLQERVDIREILIDVAKRYRPIAAKKDIELTVALCERHNIIRTDHLLLLLVLENLISNAVKFSPSGTSVEIKATCEYDSVLFQVKDEGPGFSEEDLKKVFSSFQKLSARPTAGESSTGLGLSIVKKYVQDLGGKVWIESEQGKGATFFVNLSA